MKERIKAKKIIFEDDDDESLPFDNIEEHIQSL